MIASARDVIRRDEPARAGRGTASRRWRAAGRRRGRSDRRPRRAAQPPSSARIAGPAARVAAERAVRAHDRRAAEAVLEHGRHLLGQPVLAVVVVHDEDAVVGQLVSHIVNASDVNRNDSRRRFAEVLTSVSESGRAKTTRSYGSVVRRRNARPSSMIRVTRGSSYGRFGWSSDPDLLDLRVDLDRVDMARAMLQRNRHIGAGSGAHDQHPLERPIREPAIDLLVERIDRSVERPHRLVRDAVDVDRRDAARPSYSSMR